MFVIYLKQIVFIYSCMCWCVFVWYRQLEGGECGVTVVNDGACCVITSLYPLPPASASEITDESHIRLTFSFQVRIVANFTSKNELNDSNCLKLKMMKPIDEVAELRARVQDRQFSGK